MSGNDTRLSETAYQRIKRDIVLCVLTPGESVSEARLATRYGMSKAPIRAGLARLRHEGLMSAVARRGYVVAPITVRDVQEIFHMRLILEPAAARMAAGRLEESHILRINDTFTFPPDLEGEHRDRLFLSKNKEFHLTVAEASGNRRLATTLSHLLDANERMLHLGIGKMGGADRFESEHRELTDALLENDPEGAATLALKQIKGGLGMVIDSILADPSVLDPGARGREVQVI